MALAAYRVSKFDSHAADVTPKEMPIDSPPPPSNELNPSPGLVGFEDLAGELLSDSNAVFVAKLFALSAIGSVLVKYGELYTDFVFQAPPSLALAVILVPTGLNMAKWAVRSYSPDSEFGKFL